VEIAQGLDWDRVASVAEQNYARGGDAAIDSAVEAAKGLFSEDADVLASEETWNQATTNARNSAVVTQNDDDRQQTNPRLFARKVAEAIRDHLISACDAAAREAADSNDEQQEDDDADDDDVELLFQAASRKGRDAATERKAPGAYRVKVQEIRAGNLVFCPDEQHQLKFGVQLKRHNLTLQLQQALMVVIRGLDVWQMRSVSTNVQGELQIDLRLVRAPRVMPPSTKNPSKPGRVVPARDPATLKINPSLAAAGAGELATSTTISLRLKEVDAEKVMSDLKTFSKALREAAGRADWDNEPFPASFDEEAMKAKATAIDKEHGVIRAVAPLLDARHRDEYERRRSLIFKRIEDFRQGEPRIDRCPCCGRRVMILRTPDLGRQSNTAYVYQGERPLGNESAADIAKGTQVHDWVCPATFHVDILNLKRDGTLRERTSQPQPTSATSASRPTSTSIAATTSMETTGQDEPAVVAVDVERRFMQTNNDIYTRKRGMKRGPNADTILDEMGITDTDQRASIKDHAKKKMRQANRNALLERHPHASQVVEDFLESRKRRTPAEEESGDAPLG